MQFTLPENQEEKICLECGAPLGPGRGDRKFCNDVCRTAYNNDRRKKAPVSLHKLPELMEHETYSSRHVYEILLKNRTTLYYYSEFFGDHILLRDLVGRGFNLKFFTSEFTDTSECTYRFCFDYGYAVRGEDVYILYRPEEVQ